MLSMLSRRNLKIKGRNLPNIVKIFVCVLNTVSYNLALFYRSQLLLM